MNLSHLPPSPLVCLLLIWNSFILPFHMIIAPLLTQAFKVVCNIKYKIYHRSGREKNSFFPGMGKNDWRSFKRKDSYSSYSLWSKEKNKTKQTMAFLSFLYCSWGSRHLAFLKWHIDFYFFWLKPPPKKTTFTAVLSLIHCLKETTHLESRRQIYEHLPQSICICIIELLMS